MKNVILALLFLVFVKVDSLKLENVLVLSRHNLRTPLTSKLQSVTSHTFPAWDTEDGYLTAKGVLLEEFMGEYFNGWLRRERLFTEKCPDEGTVFMYSNVKQRTIETAKAFAYSAFKNCNVSVNFKKNAKVDPVFNPVIKNDTSNYKELFTNSMQEKLDNLDLNDAYEELNKIVDLKNSEICKTQSFCNFVEQRDAILYKVGEEPNIVGPLSISNSLVDSFLMSYYSGADTEEVAWGKITTQTQWRKLLKITKENQNIRFNHTLARDIAKHMLNQIKTSLLDKSTARKFTMLVGHDSNLNSVLAALEFKSYALAGQYELTPIGGKIVFQKWRDEKSKEFFRVEYVYQTMDQLRNATPLSLENPPNSVILELKHCKTDVHGFCPWNDFANVMKNIN